MLLRHIRYLLAVAEHGNFTRAAEALHVSQPTLSQQIIRMEEQLQLQLLDRSGRAVRLTDAGEAYVEFAANAMRELEAGRRAMNDVQDLRRGKLRIGMTPTFTTYLIGPLLARFNGLHPGIKLGIQEMSQEKMEAALANDQIDLGIAFSLTRSDDIESTPLFVENLTLVAGAQYGSEASVQSATGGIANMSACPAMQPLSLAALQETPLAMLTEDFATRQHVDQFFRAHGVTPRIAIEANSIGAIVEILKHSKLLTILPDLLTNQYEGLHRIRLDPPLPQRTAALLARRSGYKSAAAKALVALLLETTADKFRTA
jgi:LysR family cyn operon transcriptional activator